MTSTSLTSIGGIALTPVEQRYGRLMRAPDHDSAGGDAGGDSGAGNAGDGPAADTTGAGDTSGEPSAATGSDDVGNDGDSDAGSGADGVDDAGDTSPLGSAKQKDDDAGDGDGEGDDNKTPAVPETYELEPITIGEGDDAQQLAIDTGLLEEVTPTLKEAGVTNEQLKQLAPLAIKIEERVRNDLNDQFAATKTDWLKAAKADEEIGGKNWDSSLHHAAKALDTFGAPSEMKEVDGKMVETNPVRVFFNQTGLGHHPELIRFMARVGAAVSEDGALPRGDRGAPEKKDRLATLYPNDVPKPKEQ